MKKGAVLILSLLVVTLMISFVSADPIPTSVGRALDGVFEVIRPILELALGTPANASGFNSSISEFFLGKLLIGIIFVTVVLTILEVIPPFDKSVGIQWTLAIVIGILGIRFLSPALIETIILPYSAIAVAITAIIPLLLAFFFIERSISSPIIRRFFWALFAVIFTCLYFARYDKLSSATETWVVWVYPAAAVLGIVFLLMDGTLQRFMAKWRVERSSVGMNTPALISLNKQLADIHSNFASQGTGYAGVTPSGRGKTGYVAYDKDVKYIQKLIIQVSK